MSPFRTAPVTAECLVICAALFMICHARSFDPDWLQPAERWVEQMEPGWRPVIHQLRGTISGISFHEAQRQWGAAMNLRDNSNPYEPQTPIQRQLHGPFDLWDGEWWRIPISAFHHGSLLHLLLNSSAAWVFGKRLERRWGSLRYLLFLGPSVVIPLLAEALCGGMAVGFSGAICAMLGALMVVQASQPGTDDLPEESITISLGCILLGIAATALELYPIANVAHISGVVYGWCAAWVFCRPGPGVMTAILRPLFLAAHLLIIPGMWFVSHPIYNGRYLWYLAERNPSLLPERRESLLKQAVRRDPTLTGVWLRLAEQQFIEGNLEEGWKQLILGLANNPDDKDLMSAARRVWRRLPFGPDRDLAHEEVKRIFGDKAEVWMQQFRETRLAGVRHREKQPGADQTPLDPRQFPLDQPVDLDWRPPRQAPSRPRFVDPDRPDSASEGATL